MPQSASDIAQSVLKRAAARAEHAEVIFEESESAGVSFQDDKLKTVSSSAVRGVGLRIIHKGRLGFSSTNDMDAIDLLISNALDSAAFGQEAKFAFPASAAGARQVQQFDPAVPALTMERAAEMMREGIDCIHASTPDAHCGGGIGRDAGSSVICNSAGLHHEETSTGYSMGIGAFLVRGESFLSVDEGASSCRFDPDLMRHARKVNDWIRMSQKEVHLGEETLPVLFTPRAYDFMLGTFEANTNGKTVQKGASLLAKRMGERILDARVSIWDDPWVDFADGSMSADGEGVPARRKALFEKGVLKTFLYDLQTAGMMGTQSTGNGMRGYGSMPRPGEANLRLEPGQKPMAEILRGMKRGLLVDAALGAGQSNVLAGAFSVNIELGFLVENGEVVGRVKDCMLAGNAFEAFNRIREISAETEWHGSLEAPFICFDALSAVGRAH